MAVTVEIPSKSKSARVTLRTVRNWVRCGEKFAMLTCYDATTAGWLWRGGIRCILVGDTAAQMILGHDSTLPVSMQFMVEITAAVRRGAPDVFLMGDMPFGSYHASADQAVQNAIRFLKEADADVVKLEVDASSVPLVERLSQSGVPVVAHLGSLPQHVRAEGGYRVAGRSIKEANSLVNTAERMVRAGAVMILVEAVPAEVSQRVVVAVEQVGNDRVIPVIGCGGGPPCHGHVVVLHDLLGLTSWQPSFAKPVVNYGQQLQSVAATWSDQIAKGRYPGPNHPYKMKS